MAIGLGTYQDASRREDLLSVLKDVSGLNGNYLMSNLGTAEAKQTLHEWLIYDQSRATSVTFVAEGADATVADLSAPTRSVNVTSILTEVIQVTGTERAVETGTREDPWTFQKRKGLERMSQKMEWSLVNKGTFASGSSGVARGMLGLDGVISTHVTARASGTSVSVTELEDMLEEVWTDVGMSDVGTTVLVPMGIKRTISGFSTSITNYANDTKTLFRNISIFDSSAGQVKIVPHKDVRNVAGSGTMYLINEDMYKVAYLRRPSFKDLALSGDYERGQYLTEYTMESLAEKTSAKRTGYKVEAVE